ncbi:interleukin-12 subunit alpha [Syngnathoides biaculeatus]|uniref:interleukin-12 subunit alpha n=1 Tax=Syngnathoides biaculeatus TaxID=300417 RepID=UPI002ADE4FE5|nr:interleukin-12 subunit alpha [Syngnathoides biaculeatus]
MICCLLLTSTLKWRTSTSLPVHNQLSAEECANCSALLKSLLADITGLLGGIVCYGIPSDKAIVSSSAETVQACAPSVQQNSNCMVQRNTSFSERECVTSIMKDMTHYEALIQSYLTLRLRSPTEEKAILSTTLEIIRSLKNCFQRVNGGMNSAEEVTSRLWGDNSFTNRCEMCEMMRGFHIRAVTINRAMGYIFSGDHWKQTTSEITKI